MGININYKKSYPYFVWLSTLALGPILYMEMLSNNAGASPLGIAAALIYFFFFGILFSAPAFFIYLFLFRYLLRDRLAPMTTKFLSCLTAIVILITTLYVVGYRDFNERDSKRLILSYAFIIVFSSFVFKVKDTRQSS